MGPEAVEVVVPEVVAVVAVAVVAVVWEVAKGAARSRGGIQLACSSCASSIPTRAVAAETPKSIPACTPAMSSIRERVRAW